MARAKRSLGQNFLADPTYQRRIAAAVDPQPDDEVIEIGPGTGAITQHLAGHVRRFVAVELDDALHAALAARYAGTPGVTLVHGNFLHVEPGALSRSIADAKVVGNIPYNITTPLLFRLLDRAWRPRTITVMVQKEVADRILAPPGDKQYGALSVGVRTVASAARLFHVPRGAFRPAPNVDSTVLRIVPLRPPPLDAQQERDVRSLTRAAFGWRRKQLQRILRSSEVYALGVEQLAAVTATTGIDMEARPETLSPARFVELAAALRAVGRPDATHEPDWTAE